MVPIIYVVHHFYAVHMEWNSKRVPAPLSKAFIQYQLMLLPTLKYKHEESQARALAALHKARGTSKATLHGEPQDPAIEGLKALPETVRTVEH